jgi:hypothetical protein
MNSFASGSSAAVGLLGGGASGPPVGPETVGRPPSNFEAPAIPLRPFPVSMASVPEIKQDEEIDVPPPAAEVRRLVVRLLGGDEVELGNFDERDDAMLAAKELVARFSSAEAAGEWPEIEGRFLRPGSVASIDVLIAN